MRFRLESAHTWPGDVYLEEGTEVGDDTKYPIYDTFVPSSAMYPLDDEAREAIDRTRSNKGEHWSNRPEDNLPIRGDMHPVHKSPQASNQPIIPPPLEHLTHPNTMKPGEPQQLPPHIVEALEEQRAEQDKIEAMKANDEADKRAQATPGPAGVTASTPTGPKPPQAPAVGRKPEPPKPASQEVPRNTSGLTPESPDGKPQDLSKENKDKKDK